MDNKKHYVTYLLDERGQVLTSSAIYENKEKFDHQHAFMEKEFSNRAKVIKIEYENYFQAKIDSTLKTLATLLTTAIETQQITKEELIETISKLNIMFDDTDDRK